MQIEIRKNDHKIIVDDFSASEMRMCLEEGATVDFYNIIDSDNMNTVPRSLSVVQHKQSTFRFHSVNIKGGSSSLSLSIRHEGDGAACVLNGCVVAGERDRVEHNIHIDHQAQYCSSSVLYKYVLSDEAVGVFSGRVLVRKGAQHTISDETNNNLCTSRACRMFTKPELEIYADDVKCSHGSTVGWLNEQALFYMQQRGIPLADAKRMLQHAFISEVLNRIPDKSRYAHLLSEPV